jgi:hypothetical protein
MKVLAGISTSSPGPSPAARSTSSRASVPLPTPRQCATPVKEAKARSKVATSGPRMKLVAPSTRWKPAATSSAI